MPLTVYTGRAGAGKRERAEKSFMAAEKAVFVVPEQASHEEERRLTALLGVLSSDKKVLSFRRMARVVLAKYAKGRKVLTGAGKQMLAAMVLKEQNEALSVLYGGYKKQGMVSCILQEISRMKRYGNSPEKMLSAADTASIPRIAEKMRDFGTLYHAYEERSQAAFLDKDDEIAILAEHMESYPDAEHTLFIFYGFTGFTPNELSVISALLAVGASVEVFLCLDENDKKNPAFQTAMRTLDALGDLEKPMVIPLFSAEKKEDAFLHLEKNFFKERRAVYTEDVPMHIFRAKSLESECARAAQTVEQLVREGVRYRDILILSRDAATYERYLKDAFAAKKIPCFFDKKEAVVRHPVIVFLLSAIDIVSKGYTMNTVLAYMKSGFSGLSTDAVSRLENYILATGVKGAAWTDDAKWNRKKGFFLKKHQDAEEKELEEIDALRKKLTEPLSALKEQVKGKHTAAEHCRAFYAFTEKCKLSEKLEEKAEMLRDGGDMERASRTIAIFNAYIDVLDSLHDMFESEQMSFETFGYLLQNGLAATEIGIIPTVLDAVRFSDVARFRGESPVVLILGANEGVFPKRGSDSGFMTERDFHYLKTAGLAVPPTRRETAMEEMSLVYQALTAAKSRLYISCCTEHEGMVFLPSFIVDRMKKLFPQIEDTNDYLPDETLPLNEEEAFGALVQQMRKAKDENKALVPVWKALHTWFSEREGYKDRLLLIDKAMKGLDLEQTMSEQTAERMMGGSQTVSVSRLECFKRCPYSYFLQYILKVEPRQELTATVADIGSYMHNIVELFTKEMIESKTMTWQDADAEYIDKAVEKWAAEVEKEINPHAMQSPKTKYLLSRLRAATKKAILMIREHIIRGCYEPLGAEISFDEDTKYIPLTIAMPDGTTLKLRGKIDRADVYEGENGTYFRIVDYKTGNRDLDISDVYQGMSLQLMVYMTALSEQPGKKMTGAGMLYFRLEDPILNKDFSVSDDELFRSMLTEMKMRGILLKEAVPYCGMDRALSFEDGKPSGRSDYLVLGESRLLAGEEMELLKKHTKKLVAALYREIKKGKVPIHPQGKDTDNPCTFCPGKGICGFVPSCGHQMETMAHISREEIFEHLKKEGEDDGLHDGAGECS